MDKGARYIGNSHVTSVHCIDDSGYHKDLLNDGGGACLFLCHVIPLYSSVAIALGLDCVILFLLQEHQIGQCGPAILSAELLWVIWIQGFHRNQLEYFLINSSDSAFTEALQALLRVILSHDDLRNWSELLVHAVL